MKSLNFIWDIATSKSMAFLLAVAGLTVAVYSVWFYHPRPEIAVELLSDTKVLDIRESIGKLDVTYGGESLKATNKELRILQVVIANHGAADITKDAYDPETPFGFRVRGGEILERPSFIGSSDYLSKFVALGYPDKQTISLNPIILESGEWIQLKLLVATRAGDTIGIEPIGKLAGVKRISVVDMTGSPSRRSFWSRIVSSDEWGIRIFLAPVWFVLFCLGLALCMVLGIAIFAGIGVPVGKLRDIPIRKHRAKLVKTYEKSRNLEPADHLVVDEYLKRGRASIVSLKDYIQKIDQINQRRRTIKEMQLYLAKQFDSDAISENIEFREHGNFRRSGTPVPTELIRIEDKSVSDDQRPWQHMPVSPEARRLGLELELDGIINVSPTLASAIEKFEKYLLDCNEGPLDKESTRRERMLK